jgi:hypothetical protein
MLKKLKKYSKLLLNFSDLVKPKKYIFIFSHMRARSTLLSHIIGSHQDVCGHEEMHAQYTSFTDLVKVKVNQYVNITKYNQSKYLLDKLLHNKLKFNTKLFETECVKHIFVLREPQSCLLSMTKRHLQHNSITTVHLLESYYLERIYELERLWDEIPHNKIYVNSDNLMENTEHELVKLSNYLALEPELTKEYEIFENTGVAGKGDMSVNITLGKISNEISYSKPNENVEHAMSLLNLEKMQDAYKRANAKFRV